MNTIKTTTDKGMKTWVLTILAIFNSLFSLNEAQAQTFHIPPQSLSGALNDYAEAANVQLSYPASQASGLRSSGIEGDYTPQLALQQLLEGTGLSAKQTANGTVTLVAQGGLVKVADTKQPELLSDDTTLPKVTVEADVEADPYDPTNTTDPYNKSYTASSTSTATKTDTPVMSTPFSVKTVTQQVLKDQQAVRIEKVMQNVSGVVRTSSIGSGVDSFNIRGFNNTSVYRNGVLFPSTFNSSGIGLKRDLANIQSIDVLKGPASILFGRTQPGGIVNITTKQPLATSYYSLGQQFGSFDFYRTTLDATGPLTKDGDLLYRFNLGYENSDSFEDFVYNDRVLVAPVLKWNISPQTQVTFELEYLHSNDQLQNGIPPITGSNRPAPVARGVSLGEAWSNEFTDDVLVGMNWSHAFNENWTLRHRFLADFLDQGGNPGSFALEDAQPNGTLSRAAAQIVGGPKADRYFNTVDLTGKFGTGPVKHTLMVGGDYYRTDESLVNQYCCPAISQTPAFNIFRPIHTNAPPANLIIPANAFGPLNSTTEWYGVYLQDQLELPFNLYALGGLRYDNAVTRDNVTRSISNDDDKISPRGGLLWQPLKWLSVYGSYSENFGTSNGFKSGKPLPFEKAKQWESGLKTAFFDDRLTATFSYFELTKQNTSIPDPNDRPFGVIAAGELESHGVEFDVAGEILPGWQLIANYAYTPFAEITKGNALAFPPVGSRFANVPLHNGNLWSTYEFTMGQLKGFKLGAGVNAVSQREGNPGNTWQIPGYALVNLMASYSLNIGKATTHFQLNVDNLLDHNYFSGTDDSTAYYGAPRTFMGSVRVEY